MGRKHNNDVGLFVLFSFWPLGWRFFGSLVQQVLHACVFLIKALFHVFDYAGHLFESLGFGLLPLDECVEFVGIGGKHVRASLAQIKHLSVANVMHVADFVMLAVCEFAAAAGAFESFSVSFFAYFDDPISSVWMPVAIVPECWPHDVLTRIVMALHLNGRFMVTCCRWIGVVKCGRCYAW